MLVLGLMGGRKSATLTFMTQKQHTSSRSLFLAVSLLLLGVSGCNNTGIGGGGDVDASVADLSVSVVGDAGPRINLDAFYYKDPPLMFCGLDGGGFPPPPQPGGTPECPDDKNREGCPCPKAGMTAPCWPGARANRGLGICKDGTTTCLADEISNRWGACVGYTLPLPGATSGANACKCFSQGQWKLDNLSPCFLKFVGAAEGSSGAVSTVLRATDNVYICPTRCAGKSCAVGQQCDPGSGTCVSDVTKYTEGPEPFSPNTVTADCTGHFKLCYTLRAGDVKNPQAGDCIMASVCTESDLTQKGAPIRFPPLPSWVTKTEAQRACAQQFAATGGYGEMSVDGTSVTCDAVKSLFLRVGYCKLSCNTTPTDPACVGCMNGGSGTFP